MGGSTLFIRCNLGGCTLLIRQDTLGGCITLENNNTSLHSKKRFSSKVSVQVWRLLPGIQVY